MREIGRYFNNVAFLLLYAEILAHSRIVHAIKPEVSLWSFSETSSSKGSAATSFSGTVAKNAAESLSAPSSSPILLWVAGSVNHTPHSTPSSLDQRADLQPYPTSSRAAFIIPPPPTHPTPPPHPPLTHPLSYFMYTPAGWRERGQWRGRDRAASNGSMHRGSDWKNLSTRQMRPTGR